MPICVDNLHHDVRADINVVGHARGSSHWTGIPTENVGRHRLGRGVAPAEVLSAGVKTTRQAFDRVHSGLDALAHTDVAEPSARRAGNGAMRPKRRL
jgi:hypothetical protein